MQRFWNSSDRLLVMLVFAVIVHALVILGIKFDFPGTARIRSSLKVVLETNFSKTAPEKAQFLAPENQIGGGDNPERETPTTIPTPESGIGTEVMPATNTAATSEVRPKHVLKQAQSEKKVVNDEGEHDEPRVEHPHLSADALRQQIADVSAEMNLTNTDRAHGPKIVEINQVSANKYKAAAYERGWQDKIERVGSLNFPDEARRKHLSGSLVLSVGLKSDGTIYSIKVDQSSGYPVLDDAAQRIVRLAAPYAPFPLELREEGDVLVIKRKWAFLSDSRVQTTP